MPRKNEKKNGESNGGNGEGAWELFEELLRSKQARVIYVYGPPGVGKTYSAYKTGRIRKGVYCVTVTEDSPSAELRGHYIPKDGTMEWVDGPFTSAMRSGGRLVINEITHASPETMTLLHPVLEGEGTSRITLPTNETVAAGAGFHTVLTDNLPPEELPEALRDRIECVVEITQPHPNALAKLGDLAEPCRRTVNLEEGRRIGLRSWLAVSKLRRSLGLRKALRAVLGEERAQTVWEDLSLGDLLEEGEEA